MPNFKKFYKQPLINMDLFIGTKISESQFVLKDEEHHHCIRVTRHKSGDMILVSDFEGIIYEGELSEINQTNAFVSLKKIYKQEDTSLSQIIIAISPTQQMDRFEWFVEKAVESGVHKIVPIICKRTENSKIKSERLSRIVSSSAKQTLRPLKPEITEIIGFKEYVEQNELPSQRFIAHCESDSKLFLGTAYNAKDPAVVLIGPAGDFTLEEIRLAKIHDYKPVSLGDYRLRTETAGLSAIQILQTIRHI